MRDLLSIFDVATEDYIVARYQGQLKTQQQFLVDVRTAYHYINHQEAKSDLAVWVLFFDEAYLFAVALLALSLSGKKILLPGNITEHTLAAMAGQSDAFLGNMPQSQFNMAERLTQSSSTPSFDLPKLTLTSELVVFTSGSSGEPKAIAKTLQQFNAEVIALEQCFSSKLSRATWHIATVSHQHIYGLIFRVLWPLAARRPFVSEQILDAGLLLRTVIEYGEPALWVASPAHLKRVHEDLPWQALQPYLQEVFSSGGPLSLDAARQCKAFMGFCPVEVFGSSETGGIAQRRQIESPYWQALPNVNIKALANSDEQASLMVQSPHIDAQRWYQTDDAIELLSDGRFALKGRLDRIVKLEEKRLSLVELEKNLDSHALLSESYALVVVGQGDLQRDVLAVAAVLSPQGKKVLNAEGKLALVNHVKQALKKHFELSLIPKKWRFVDELPVNAQAKIDKPAIQQLFKR